MSYQNPEQFTGDDVIKLIAAVHYLTDETSRIFNQYSNEPTDGSIALQEYTSFPNRELADVHYAGILSMEAAADHLMVFAESITEPAKTVAPWTCVRGLLESCALALWFLDTTTDVKTRVGRHFAFRYAGFVQQIKLFQVDDRQQEISKVQQRIRKVDQDAAALGYPRLLNKAGALSGIAQHMPSITSLIGITLQEEGAYRLLSAVAHGHHWATHQTSFKVIEYQNASGEVAKGLEKHVHPTFILYVGMVAVTSFAKVLWHLWLLYGWDVNEMKELLEATYDRLTYAQKLRFWRP